LRSKYDIGGFYEWEYCNSIRVQLMKIQIIELRLLSSERTLKAFCDVRVDGIIVREFRVVKENGKRPWVVSPQISWKDHDGQIKYKTVITFPDEVKGQVDLAILKAYTEEMEKSNGRPAN
jgi:DNA-binding cell septation regulator SpoVG